MKKKTIIKATQLFSFFLILISLFLNKYESTFSKSRIYIGLFYNELRNGGTQRSVATLSNILCKTGKYNIFLITKEKDEFFIDASVKRMIGYDKNNQKEENVKQILQTYKIDILIYNSYYEKEVDILLKFKKKLINIHRNQYFHYYYRNNSNIYKTFDIFQKSDLFITFIQDDIYLWKKRGIKRIISLPNLIPFNFNWWNSNF